MKAKLFVLASLLVILACLLVAVAVSKDHTAATNSQTNVTVVKLQKQLDATQAQLKLHDSVNSTAITNAGDQIILLTNQKNTLCNQIKAARLVQPLCP